MIDPTRAEATWEELTALQQYISDGWSVLERSHSDLFEAVVDEKVEDGESPPIVYASRDEDIDAVRRRLKGITRPEDFERIEITHLPESFDEIEHHGLLYLPFHYIVPGGSFNEMYGWDSYFIQRGLLRSRLVDFACDLANNLIYQVEKYGTVLNANRTYYLTRSQPPFLSGNVLEAFRSHGNRGWLEEALPSVEKYYRFWTEGPRHVERYQLSRYYDAADTPAPEVFGHERDREGLTHYDRVRQFYKEHGDEITDYDLSLYYDRETDSLTPLFFRADRAMRESGHDPSNRFGAFNIGVLDMLPVDLNCLLYRMELELGEINRILNRTKEAREWGNRAGTRAILIQELMWDDEAGLYFDVDFKKGTRRQYPYVTAFFPMWVGLASDEQAARIVDNLHLLDRPGGLQTSITVSGNQWDSPLGWAPMHVVATEALRRYGFKDHADRIAINFLSMVLKEFIEHAAVLEKYNVVARESEIPAEIRFGYSVNEIGFGWTNAAFVEMFADLPPGKRQLVRLLQGVPDAGSKRQ